MFKREIADKIREEWDARRQAAESAADARREELHRAIPGLFALDERRRSLPLRVLDAAMRGVDLDRRLEEIKTEDKALQAERVAMLAAAGFPADYDHVRYTCPDCEDTGYRGGEICPCFRRAVVEETIRASGFGKLMARQTFANFDLSYYSSALLEGKRYSARDVMREILTFCENWADSFSLDSPSLLFIGGTGLGKTHLSSAMAGKVIEKGFDVAYESVPLVLQRAERERFREEDDDSVVRRCLDAELLILDDLGAEAPSKATASVLYSIVNTRAAVRGVPTIISTNLSYRQLEKQYDTAITSRLFGDFTVKLFQGEDVRRVKIGR